MFFSSSLLDIKGSIWYYFLKQNKFIHNIYIFITI